MTAFRTVGRAPRARTLKEPSVTDSGTVGLASLAHFAGLAVLIGSLLAANFSTAQSSLTWLPTVYLVACSLLFLRALLDPRAGSVSVLVSIFFLFFVALPACVQIPSAEFPFGGIYDPASELKGLTILGVGQLAYLAGASRHTGRSGKREPLSLDPDLAHRAMLLAALVSVAVIAYVGPAQLMLPRFVLVEYVEESGGLVGQASLIGRSISLFGVLLCIALWRTSADIRRRPIFLISSAVLIGSFAVLNYPPSLPRFQMLGAALAVISVVLSTFGSTFKWIFGLATPFFLFLLFPIIKALGNGDGEIVSSATRSNPKDYLVTADFDAYKQTIDTSVYVAGYGLRGLDSVVGTLFFWAPRSVWEGKPTPSGAVVSEALGYPFTNVSSPLPAEGYLAAGMIGVVVVMFAFGLMAARAETAARVQVAGSINLSLIFYALLAGFTVIILRGAILAVAPMFGPGFVAYGLLAAAQRSRNRRRASSVG